MGLFDKALGSPAPEALKPPEAFAGILVAVGMGDGDLADEEIDQLITALPRMKLFQGYSDDQQNALLRRLMGMVKKSGAQAVLSQCAQACPENLRFTAFAKACDIVLADGVVEPVEKQMLEKLVKALSVPVDVAQKIVEVMVIKNKG